VCRLHLQQSWSVTFCGVWVPWIRISLDSASLLCAWPQHLELPTTSSLTVRAVAIHIQAPAQDPPLPALVCWLKVCLLTSGAVVTVTDSGANYKCSDSSQLISPLVMIAHTNFFLKHGHTDIQTDETDHPTHNSAIAGVGNQKKTT